MCPKVWPFLHASGLWKKSFRMAEPKQAESNIHFYVLNEKLEFVVPKDPILANVCLRRLRRFQCTLCSKSFKSSFTRNRHLKLSHKVVNDISNIEHKCSLCEKVFPYSSNLRKHEQTHLPLEERRIFQCQHFGCYKAFVSKDSLKTHLKNNHWTLSLTIFIFCFIHTVVVTNKHLLVNIRKVLLMVIMIILVFHCTFPIDYWAYGLQSSPYWLFRSLPVALA